MAIDANGQQRMQPMRQFAQKKKDMYILACEEPVDLYILAICITMGSICIILMTTIVRSY